MAPSRRSAEPSLNGISLVGSLWQWHWHVEVTSGLHASQLGNEDVGIGVKGSAGFENRKDTHVVRNRLLADEEMIVPQTLILHRLSVLGRATTHFVPLEVFALTSFAAVDLNSTLRTNERGAFTKTASAEGRVDTVVHVFFHTRAHVKERVFFDVFLFECRLVAGGEAA